MAKRTLIKGGTIISMDAGVGDLRAGDLLIEGGRIAQIAPEIADVETDDVIDARNRIVMPGLVDPHRHLWYSVMRGAATDAVLRDMFVTQWPKIAAHFAAEDVYIANRAAIVNALSNGITTVVDWCHVIHTAEHAKAGLRPHLELPIRSIFAVASPGNWVAGKGEASKWEIAVDLLADQLAGGDQLTQLALAVPGPEMTPSFEAAAEDFRVARELGVPMSMHIGASAGTPPVHAVKSIFEADLLDRDMQFVHCCTTTGEEFALMAQTGASAVVCPMAEMTMGLGAPPTARMRESGMPAAVGADAVCSASGDQFDEARTAMFAERMMKAQEAHEHGPIEDVRVLGMTSRQALEAVTVHAAGACWLGDVTGSLTPGKAADVILLSAEDLDLAPAPNVIAAVVGSAHAGNVETVIVNGEVVKRDGRLLLDVDPKKLAAELAAVRDRVYGVEYEEGIVPAAG